jgi:hypothetical protein
MLRIEMALYPLVINKCLAASSILSRDNSLSTALLAICSIPLRFGKAAGPP